MLMICVCVCVCALVHIYKCMYVSAHMRVEVRGQSRAIFSGSAPHFCCCFEARSLLDLKLGKLAKLAGH